MSIKDDNYNVLHFVRKPAPAPQGRVIGLSVTDTMATNEQLTQPTLPPAPTLTVVPRG